MPIVKKNRNLNHISHRLILRKNWANKIILTLYHTGRMWSELSVESTAKSNQSQRDTRHHVREHDTIAQTWQLSGNSVIGQPLRGVWNIYLKVLVAFFRYIFPSVSTIVGNRKLHRTSVPSQLSHMCFYRGIKSQCGSMVVPFSSRDCIRSVVNVWAWAQLTAYVGRLHALADSLWHRGLWNFVFFDDALLEYGVPSWNMVYRQLIPTCELYCCNKDSIIYFINSIITIMNT